MDTLEHSRQLVAAGFTQQQAETQTKLLNEVFVNEFATKKELNQGFSEVQLQFKEVNNQFREVQNQFREVKNQFKEVQNQFREVHIQISELRAEIKNLPGMILQKLFSGLAIAAAILAGIISLIQFFK